MGTSKNWDRAKITRGKKWIKKDEVKNMTYADWYENIHKWHSMLK